MSKTPIAVEILGHEFKISAPEGYESDLKEAAAYLNEQMQDIKIASQVTNLEKLAIIAALNMAHDLLTAVKTNSKQERVIKQLCHRLETIVEKTVVEKSDSPQKPLK